MLLKMGGDKGRHVPGWLLAGIVLLSACWTNVVMADAPPVVLPEKVTINMAVEFMDHAAAAFIARDQGWFEEAGLEVRAYESYATGMALAAALSRGDVQVAYLCLVPAINACVNAEVPMKIVAGTHKYGYGLVVDSRRVKGLRDLQAPGIRLGCVREGGAVDVLLRRIIDSRGLDADRILPNVRRMSPAQQVLAITMGQLDAAVLPEHWATMAETAGFKMQLTAQDVWPDMQGSVLAVRDDLIATRPEAVSILVDLLDRGNRLIHDDPRAAAEMLVRQMGRTDGGIIGEKSGPAAGGLTSEILLRSMDRLEFTTAIDPLEVQKTIDYLVGLGYIKKRIAADKILDLRFLDNAGIQ